MFGLKSANKLINTAFWLFVCDNSQKCKVDFTFSCNIIWKISKYILSLQA